MAADRRFAVCVDNADYSAALEVRKVYEILPDSAAASRSYLRVIDESGEDYLYPRRMFLQVKVRPEARATLARVLRLVGRKSANPSKKATRRGRSSQGTKATRLRTTKRAKRYAPAS